MKIMAVFPVNQLDVKYADVAMESNIWTEMLK